MNSVRGFATQIVSEVVSSRGEERNYVREERRWKWEERRKRTTYIATEEK